MTTRDLIIDLIAFVIVVVLFVRGYVRNIRSRLSPDMLTLREASNYFLITVQTLKQLTTQSLIKSYNVLGTRYVNKDDVNFYLNKPAEPVNNFLPDLPESTNDPS